MHHLLIAARDFYCDRFEIWMPVLLPALFAGFMWLTRDKTSPKSGVTNS